VIWGSFSCLKDYDTAVRYFEQARPLLPNTQSFRSRPHDAVIRVYDEAGDVIETHEQAGRVQRVVKCNHVAIAR
jgi:hypothetical protein